MKDVKLGNFDPGQKTERQKIKSDVRDLRQCAIRFSNYSCVLVGYLGQSHHYLLLLPGPGVFKQARAGNTQ